MPVFQPFTGMPGPSAEKIAKHRTIAADGYLQMLPGGGQFDGTKTRDVWNPDGDPTRLEAGLLVGKVTASGKLANCFFGSTAGALANVGTSITLTAVAATELVRRIGTSGTFKLVGPPTAAGVVRVLTVTYSAVNTSTGVVTLTALGVNEVQTLTFGAAATGGTLRLVVPKADGTLVVTDAIAWNATDATYLASINTALDAATGVAGGIVATGAAPDTALTFTFSGTGYAGLNHAMIQVHTFPTSTTTAVVVETTAGVDGRMVAGSLVGDTDGSHVPQTFLPDGWEIPIPADGVSDFPFPQMPIEGNLTGSNLLPWPADASLRQWIRDQLKTYGRFGFTEQYAA